MVKAPLTLSHGVLVRKGSVALGSFFTAFTARPGNSRFSGKDDELQELVVANFANSEPGTGSVDGDVLLISLPTAGFNTNIVPINEENVGSIETLYEPRATGEAPVVRRVLRTGETAPAGSVKVVVYRADTLERDSGRSTDAEWEIVAVLANPTAETPMSPTTMLRNLRHHIGGTYREYSAEQWADAYEFWNSHVQTTPAEV